MGGQGNLAETSMLVRARGRKLAAFVALWFAVAPAMAQSTPTITPAQAVPRPVHDASNWAAVMGPLRSLWDAWKSEEAAAGRVWDDMGHITNTPGATIVGGFRADQVPPSATAWIVSNAEASGILAGANPGDVAIRQAAENEAVRVQNEAAAAAAAAAAGQDGDGSGGDGDGSGSGSGDDDGPGSDAGGRPGDDDEPGGGGDDDGGSGGGEDTPPLNPGDDDGGGDGGGDGSGGGGTGGGGGSIPELGEREDIAYGDEHPRQVLDLYLPEGAADGAPLRTFIFFHGGGFYRGDKKDVSYFMPLVEQGYALASCNYYLLQKNSFEDINFLSDAKEVAKAAYDARKAVRFLRENADQYNLDANQFIAAGASAGGYLAAVVGSASNESSIRDEGNSSSTSAAVQAVVDWSGPTNFATFLEHKTGQSQFPAGAATSVLNGAGAVSPFDFVDGGDPPTLIRHGQNDPVVPYQQSETYGNKIQQAGVEVDMKIYPNLGHEPDSQFLDAEIQATTAFLDRVLN